ncbi:hypothetical protein U2I54_26445 [Bacillus pseudomycoides]|uniref:DUF3742 family protein n=1 Tax=Bacillus bingmayongensis TaxID=1150157 RepID=A0ABU5K435_9BACI|nr:hypothetical protein [Bacillus pseudomycoides]
MVKWRVESRLGELVKKEKEISGESDTRIHYTKRSKRIIGPITDKILLVVHFIITLAPLIVTVAFIGWILYAIFWPEDPYEKYYENHDNNPYNQDWNGDGWKGTKEDHDFHHKYFK